jgi:hypothetical protein
LWPQSTQFSAEDMRGWYLPRDMLGVAGERVLPQTATLEEAVDARQPQGDTWLPESRRTSSEGPSAVTLR